VHDPSIEISQVTVKVHVIIAKAADQITLDNIPLKVGPSDKLLTAEPAVVKVTLEGDEEALKNIKASDISVSVDATKADQDRTAPVQANLPKRLATGVHVKKIEPERVLIKNR